MKRKSLDVVETITDDPRRAEITLKAITTVSTDEGTFEAVISTESVDREKDIVDAGAMVKALRAWIDVGKLIPLAWSHRPEDIIGHVDPASVKAVNGEVIASGWIDQSIERGAHAWRLVKSGTLGFSFGYLTLAATKRKGGGNHITELDVFEVSATATPMNHETRVLGWKSALEEQFTTELQEVKARLETVEKALEDQEKKAEVTDKETKSRSVDPLRQQADALALEVSSGGVSLRPQPKRPEPEPEPDLMDLKTLRTHSRDLMLQVLSGMEEAE